MPLNHLQVKNAKCEPGQKQKRIMDSGGLFLHVLDSGTKTWRWRYQRGGKERVVQIGR